MQDENAGIGSPEDSREVNSLSLNLACAAAIAWAFGMGGWLLWNQYIYAGWLIAGPARWRC